jgi:hypothetical protein
MCALVRTFGIRRRIEAALYSLKFQIQVSDIHAHIQPPSALNHLCTSKVTQQQDSYPIPPSRNYFNPR